MKPPLAMIVFGSEPRTWQVPHSSADLSILMLALVGRRAWASPGPWQASQVMLNWAQSPVIPGIGPDFVPGMPLANALPSLR